MSLEEELAELSTVYHGQKELIEALKQLVRDQDKLLDELLPPGMQFLNTRRTRLKERRKELIGND